MIDRSLYSALRTNSFWWWRIEHYSGKMNQICFLRSYMQGKRCRPSEERLRYVLVEVQRAVELEGHASSAQTRLDAYRHTHVISSTLIASDSEQILNDERGDLNTAKQNKAEKTYTAQKMQHDVYVAGHKCTSPIQARASPRSCSGFPPTALQYPLVL
jgi:hypothetical protein